MSDTTGKTELNTTPETSYQNCYVPGGLRLTAAGLDDAIRHATEDLAALQELRKLREICAHITWLRRNENVAAGGHLPIADTNPQMNAWIWQLANILGSGNPDQKDVE